MQFNAHMKTRYMWKLNNISADRALHLNNTLDKTNNIHSDFSLNDSMHLHITSGPLTAIAGYHPQNEPCASAIVGGSLLAYHTRKSS